MSLQYLTNANPPPAQSVLEYDVEPGVVFLSTNHEQLFVNLTITVTNTTNAPVNCMEFQFGFLAGAATGDLTTAAAAGAVTATSDQNAWSITNNGSFSDPGNTSRYLFTATPSGIGISLPLATGASLVFHLNDILVDQSVGEGSAPFTIIEQTGSSKSNQQTVTGSVALNKEPSSLSIGSFNVLPPTPVGPGTEISLSWEVTGAIYWRLYNATLAKLLYDSSNDPQPKTSWEDKPEAWTEYELIAYAGQIFTTAFAVAQVMNPRFTSTGAPTAIPTSVDSGAASTLSWQTADAKYVTVTGEGYTSGQITPDANGNGRVQVNPALTNTYTVTPYGADDQKGNSAQVTVSVNPPLIKSFGASPDLFQRGQAVILSWEVESASELKLNPGGVDVHGQTSHQVNPVGSVTYQLTAAGQGPPVMSAPVKVNQLLETFSVGGSPQALVYDGTYVWVVNNSSNTVTRLRATDGSNQGTFPAGNDPKALVYDGKYIWVASNDLSGVVTRLLAADGSNQGTFQVGRYPTALAYDGTYIWVANFDDSKVTRLLAADGSHQGTFAVGMSAVGLAYDGKYIWVANYSAGTVTRLRATDGSNQGVFQLGFGTTALV